MKVYRGVTWIAPLLFGCGSISDEFHKPGETVRPSIDQAPSPTTAMVDTRPVLAALKAPPPITGGTLLMSRDGMRAVAVDPDRDRVSIVDLRTLQVSATIPLQPGDEPGRVAEDNASRVHVALRRGGAVVTIDLATGTVLARRATCGAPRGIAYDPALDQIHVACSGGQLVTFQAAGGDAVRRLDLDVDLRDVIVRPGGAGLFVSRFKSGDLLSVDQNGVVKARAKLRAIERAPNSTSVSPEPIEPAVAWRTIATPEGGAVMLHQYGLASVIKLTPPVSGTGAADAAPPTFSNNPVPSTTGGDPYGTPPGGCGGLVQPALSEVGTDGTTVAMGVPIVAPVLTVDVAMSPDGSLLIAHAGVRDSNSPLPNLSPFAQTSGVSIVQKEGMTIFGSSPAACMQPPTLDVVGQVTAVAFNPVPGTGRTAAVQTREPATLVVFSTVTPGAQGQVVDLGGESVVDTGHELFHRDAGAGIACASCHAEGGEDGRIWRFDPIGDRRTQAVHIGLQGTEPFHWDGDMKNFGVLVNEVMVRRMGGPQESDARKDALQNWLFTLRPPSSIVAPNDAAAMRGQAIFTSPDAACSSCHAGEHLTSNLSVFVGTTEPGHMLQVPSLRGVGYRAPFLHNGCAVSLRDRFNPSCGGGDQHGHTSQLADADVSDLIAYLESL